MSQAQREEMLAFFKARPNQWIPVYEVARIALQYNARIKELRNLGYHIENKLIEVVNGKRHTAFRYVPHEEKQLIFV